MRAPANALARKHGRCCVSVSSSIDTVSLKYRPFSLLMATFPNVICFSIFPLLLTGGSFPLTLPVPHSEHPQSPDAPGDRGNPQDPSETKIQRGLAPPHATAPSEFYPQALRDVRPTL